MKKKPIKLTVIRTSKYDSYMRKFQPTATLQYKVIDARSIKPVRSGFRLALILKIFRSNIADQKSKLYRSLKTNKVKLQIPVTLSASGR